MDKAIGFKGFDKDLVCSGNGNTRHQYEIGKKYEHSGELKLCKSGLHFCEYPLDVFNHYPPADSRFARVEAEEVSPETDGDTKRVCRRLFIGVEITLKAMIEAAVKFTFDRADWTKKESQATGYRGAASATGDQGAASATGVRGAASATGDQGAASATGYQGAASATGDQGAASATGYQGAASATGVRGAASATGYQGAASATGVRGAASASGPEGCAVALGIEGQVKGANGSWLIAAEWAEGKDAWHRIAVKTVRVDGKKIKADTFYALVGGKFKEAK